MTEPHKRLSHTRKVSRLPGLPEDVGSIMEERFATQRARGSEPLNLHLAQGHAPELSQAKGHFTWILRNDTKLGRRLLEMTILRTAYIIDCPYELDHHVPLGRQSGLTDAQVAGLQDWRKHTQLFSEREQALLGFVDGLCNKGEVDDATYATFAKHFSPQEIVEVCYCSTSYYANGMFVKAIKLEIDAPHVKAAAGKF